MTAASARLGPGAPALALTQPVLITGGAGFVGSNLAMRLAREGHHVVVLDALSRRGVEQNLNWLTEEQGERISAVIADVRDATAVTEAASDASAVFHLAAQVAVTTSLIDPIDDLDVNVRGTVNLLEAVRSTGRSIPVVFASTNKVYGDLADIPLAKSGEACRPVQPDIARHGIGEARPLSFHTPYGCSKGAADQYVLDYARSFDVPAAVLRMSCVYGPRQFGTEDQGWVAHFLIRALQRRPITIFGDGHQVRDVLYVDDAVDAYVAAWRRIGDVRGRAFNLGGGPQNAISLRQLIAHIEELLGRNVDVAYSAERPGDQRWYVSDTRALTAALGLARPVQWLDGLGRLLAWLRDSAAPAAKDQLAPAYDAREAVP